MEDVQEEVILFGGVFSVEGVPDLLQKVEGAIDGLGGIGVGVGVGGDGGDGHCGEKETVWLCDCVGVWGMREGGWGWGAGLNRMRVGKRRHWWRWATAERGGATGDRREGHEVCEGCARG